MAFIWLIVWLLSDTPVLIRWNDWLVALIVCVILDVIQIASFPRS